MTSIVYTKNMKENYILKNNLKKLRFQNNEMSQDYLANLLNISRQTVYSIEQGKFNPSIKLSLLIAKVFNVSIEELFFLEYSENE